MCAKSVSTVLLALAMVLAARSVSADGMVMQGQTTGSTVDVRATQQRALLWLRAGEDPGDPLMWEIHIQPVFDRDQGDAAWIVPFPVKPNVHEGSQGYLDELNLATSPVFIDYCEEPSCYCPGSYYDGGAAGGTEGTAAGGKSSVKVWEQGTVGNLDYVILSTGSGDDLVNWLQTEGYKVHDGLATMLVQYNTEGAFFFCSRLSATADPTLPMSVVRFVLPGMDPAIYPLRLTGLGVETGEHLTLTLWVILPDPWSGSADRNTWVADSHSWVAGPQDDHAMDPGKYEHELQSLLDQPDTDFVVTFAGSLSYNSLMSGSICTDHYDYYAPQVCASAADLGISLPQPWSAELTEIKDSNAQVVRYEGRLSPAALATDFTLQKVDLDTEPGKLQRQSIAYTNRIGMCDTECPPCPEINDGGIVGDGGVTDPGADDDDGGCALAPGESPAVPGAAMLLLLLLLGIAVRRG